VGTMEQPIIFTGTSETKGYWKGIAVESNNNKNVLDFVQMRFGGSERYYEAQANVAVGYANASASIAIRNSVFSDSGAQGLVVHETSRLTEFSKNVFESNLGAGVEIGFQELTSLDSTSVFSGGSKPNGFVGVKVVADNPPTTKPVTVKKLDAPFVFSSGRADQVEKIGSTLTIEAGVTMQFEANTGLLVEKTGKIITNGSATDMVVLTGLSQTKGHWKGVALLSNANVLTRTEISYAGNDDDFCCGFFEGNDAAKSALVVGAYDTLAGVTLTGVKFVQSLNRGIYALGGSTVVVDAASDVTTGNGQPNILSRP
jgi:hypothetical protein